MRTLKLNNQICLHKTPNFDTVSLNGNVLSTKQRHESANWHSTMLWNAEVQEWRHPVIPIEEHVMVPFHLKTVIILVPTSWFAHSFIKHGAQQSFTEKDINNYICI
jgi:hypothetical protein